MKYPTWEDLLEHYELLDFLKSPHLCAYDTLQIPVICKDCPFSDGDFQYSIMTNCSAYVNPRLQHQLNILKQKHPELFI